MNMIDNSQRTAAKVAGIAGLLTFADRGIGNYVLLNPLVVPAQRRRRPLGTSWRTKRNFASRLFAFSPTASAVVVLLTALYVILTPVNPGLALDRRTVSPRLRVLWLLRRSICLAALRLW